MENALTITIPVGFHQVEFAIIPTVPAGDRTITITSDPALTVVGSPLTLDYVNPPTTVTLAGPYTAQVGTPATYTLTLDQLAMVPVVITVTDSASADDVYALSLPPS